ncbi:hypothetical protein ASF44_23430 [Pseudorhodoferax sp. Leaf274]|nr:hypothetical protein ASF44_23430 [Pseudorhodoferax sp. Leaf274]
MGLPDAWPEGLKVALSLVVNSPESMILCWGPELHFFFNETYIPLLGPRVDWAMGSPFDEVWADALAQAHPIIAAAMAGQSQRFNDLPWKLATDRGQADTWWTFSYSRILGPDGAIAGLFIFTNETTNKVLADAALKDSNEQLRLVIEGAKDHAIFTVDPAGHITTWSAGAQAIFGWTAQEALGQSVALVFTPQDVADGAHVRELTLAARTGHAHDERWHITKSGRRVFMNGSVHPLPDDTDGQPRGFIKIARDDTVRQEAAAARAQEVERQRLSLQQMPGFVGILSGPEHRYEYVNDAYVAISGERDFLGRTVREVFPELAGQGFYELLDQVYATGTAYTARAMPLHLDNRTASEADRFIDFVYEPIRDASGAVSGVFAGGYDVTDQVRAQRQLAEANLGLEQRVDATVRHLMAAEEALRQAQKMEAVGQLTGGLAHDFNNLLGGITSSLELVQRHIAQGRIADVDRYVVAAQGAARRAAALTHRLLAFSRRQTLDPKIVDVNLLVAGLEDLVRRTVGPSIEVTVVGSASLWPTLVDAPQLESALLNLCINARDAMPDGGRITIETANRWLDGQAAKTLTMAEGQYISLSVTDTGTGMTPEVMARAFEPFFTTKPLGQGTGLGLSMIYGFAQQSGGQVRIYSEVGAGTTVSIYLARSTASAEPAELPALETVGRASVGETVLLVEDEPTIRMAVTDELGELGYTVLEASDGKTALRALQSGAHIDLLLTDVGLPGGMNGRQIADAARTALPGLKVLFITGYAENAMIGDGQLEPGMAVLTKPFSLEELGIRIREMLS